MLFIESVSAPQNLVFDNWDAQTGSTYVDISPAAHGKIAVIMNSAFATSASLSNASPSGWTLLGSVSATNAGVAYRSVIYAKYIDGTEDISTEFIHMSSGSGRKDVIHRLVFTGGSGVLGTPLSGTATGSTSASISAISSSGQDLPQLLVTCYFRNGNPITLVNTTPTNDGITYDIQNGTGYATAMYSLNNSNATTYAGTMQCSTASVITAVNAAVTC